VSKILFVKTSSLGDVVHHLPVVTDTRRAFPDARIDWVVERSFSAIPSLHSGVHDIIPCELRRWRRTLLARATRKEWRAFLTRLRGTRYDAVVDTQGLLKSAIIARLAHGERYGLDWQSSREPIQFFYDRSFNVSWGQHAVTRNRRLAAFALGYELQGEPNYGIRCAPSSATWLPPKPYVVLLHATSQSRKLWPESEWSHLGRHLANRDCSSLLPWGSVDEHARAKRLADTIPLACVAPALGLAELAAVLAGASAAVGVDTGLTHLAAALGIPVVGIYGPTDPKATGICAATPAANLGGQGRFPSVDQVIGALEDLWALRPGAQRRQPA
jgi:heptosyltransferase-1